MISFSSITQSQYDELASYVQDRIYFITDSGKLMLNGNEYGGGGGSEPVNPAFAPIEVKAAAGDCVYDLDFSGAKIQKFDMTSATAGSNAIEIVFANLSGVPSGQTATYELQIPVTEADVETINLPVGTVKLDMPDALDAGDAVEAIVYHDIVFRAEKDINNDTAVYASHAYKFEEELKYREPLAFHANQSSTLRLNKYADTRLGEEAELSGHLSATFEYSTDGVNWQSYSYTGEAESGASGPSQSKICDFGQEIALNAGDTVYFRGDNETIGYAFNNQTFFRFDATGDISISGNIMSLLDKNCDADTVPGAAFLNIFRGMSAYTDASNLILPAKYVCSFGYASMFIDDANITAMPKFRSAVTLLPDAVISSDVGQYGQFYGLFRGTGLASADIRDLPKISNVTDIAPTANVGIYPQLFRNCSSLTEIWCDWDSWDPTGAYSGTYGGNWCNNWVQNVSSAGTFHCKSTLPQTFGNYAIPTNWAVVTDID